MVRFIKGNTTKAFMVLMVLSFMAFGCAGQQQPSDQPSPTKIAYSTIKSAAIAYDAVMSALGDLDAQGKITDPQKSEIIKYGNEFWRAYHTAVDALIAFKKSGNEVNLESSLSTLTSALAGFLEYSAQITS